MHKLALKVGDHVFAQWSSAIAAHLPDYQILHWNEVDDPDSVQYACVWQPEAGRLREFGGLKAIMSLAAGTDHILIDPDLPTGVPIIRIVDNTLVDRMSEYVLTQTLWLHRGMHRFAKMQRQAKWKPSFSIPASQRHIGVMGAGRLGQPTIRRLAASGFDVSVWRAGSNDIAGVRCFHGSLQLGTFLGNCDILICMLPLTNSTHGIIDRALLEQLPTGASLINVGRGEHLIESDLLRALESGHLEAAVLDVFSGEPLPPDHAFWAHDNIVITPHIASLIDPETGARALCREIVALDAGQQSNNVICRERGY